VNTVARKKEEKLIYTMLKIFPLHPRQKNMLNDTLPTWQRTKSVRHEIRCSLNHGGQGSTSLPCSNPSLLGTPIAMM
jgi:hypothetical protein